MFNFNALAAAGQTFRLEVEQTGFEKKVLDHVQLNPDQANALNVQLVIGATSQTVNVDASSLPALETETASVNGVVSENQIQHMPSFGRDVFKLIQLAPGMFADGAQGSAAVATDLPGTQSGPAPSGGYQRDFQTENVTAGYSPWHAGSEQQSIRLTVSAPPAPFGAVPRSSPRQKIQLKA